MTGNELYDKIAALCETIKIQSNARVFKQYPNLGEHYENCNFDIGKKFSRITVGSSARYFVRHEDGAIFASESYKKPNLKRQYGTLDTMTQFNWAGYNAVAWPDSDYEMQNMPGGSGYQRAVLKQKTCLGCLGSGTDSCIDDTPCHRCRGTTYEPTK